MDKTTYLVIIRFGDAGVITARVRESAPLIKKTIEKLSDGECQLAFTSRDGSAFAYLMKTTAPLPVVRAELFGTSQNARGASPLLDGDSYLAIEVGAGFDGVGLSRAWTWLQHHN